LTTIYDFFRRRCRFARATMEIIRIKSFFEFGRGRSLIEPIAHSRAWRLIYWYLIALGVLFWAALFWFSFYFPNSYS
jgi:hypothetical protein